MAGASVRVSIVAETRKFDRAMRNLKQAAGLNALKRTAAKTAKTVAAIGGASIAAGALITRSLWKAGETAATSNARIDNIARSMGIFGNQAGQVAKRVQTLADKMARSVGVDQNVIKSTQAKLLTFKQLALSADKAGGTFDRATRAAVDLAAAGFGTAESNAVQLGKALNDPIKGLTALTKSGITFTEVEREKIAALTQSGEVGKAQEIILKAIEQQVGGTAQATANASDKFKIFASQLKEHLGEKLTPIFDALADKLEAVMPYVMEFADSAIGYLSAKAAQLAQWWNTTGEPAALAAWDYFDNNLRPALEDLASGALSLLSAGLSAAGDALQAILPIIADVIAIFNEYKDVLVPLVAGVIGFVAAFKTLNIVINTVKTAQIALAAANALVSASFLASPLGWVALAIGAIIGVCVLLYMNWEKISNALKRFGSWLKDTFWGILRSVFIDMPNKIKDMLAGAADWLYNAGKDVIKGLINGIKNMIGWVKDAIGSVVSSITGGFKSLLGINSPSRVMMALSESIPEGVALGVKRNAQQAVAAVAGMGEQMTKKAAKISVKIPVGVDTLEDLPARAWHITARGMAARHPAPVSNTVNNEYQIEVKTLNATEETGRAIKNALQALENIDGAEALRSRAQWA